MIAIVNTWVGKILASAFAVLASVRYGVGYYAFQKTNQLEQPTYTILRKLTNGVELRKYDSYLIAETIVPKPGFRESTGDGFRACAGYIFGKNKPNKPKKWYGYFFSENDDEEEGGESEKMAMTAPVRVSGQTGEKMAMTAPVRVDGGGEIGETKVSFVIGKKYTLSSAPRPLDKNVIIRNVPSHILAARKFSGPPPTDNRVKREREKIEQALSEANIRPASSDGETLVYGYHDPFITPRFLRKNEVAVMVDSSTVDETME